MSCGFEQGNAVFNCGPPYPAGISICHMHERFGIFPQPQRRGMKQVTLAMGADDCTVTLGIVEAGHERRPHSHPEEQIALCIQGECDYWVDGKPCHLTPGGFVTVPRECLIRTIYFKADMAHYTHRTASLILGPCTRLRPQRPERPPPYNTPPLFGRCCLKSGGVCRIISGPHPGPGWPCRPPE